MELTPEHIRWIITYVLLLIASVAFHEFGHAFVADRLGDDTPSRQGRVTLNPLAHADPIGTIALPLISAVFSAAAGGGPGGFGWGKPVQTNPLRYSRRFSMATGQVFVAIAGPLMNVLLAVVFATTHAVLVHLNVLASGSQLNQVLAVAVLMNFTLFFFNLIPVPPLDGGWVARRFVPTRHSKSYESFAVYGPFVIMAIVMIPTLSYVISVPARFCTTHLYQGLGSLLG
jgi:Zn-dependent protease